MAAPETGNSIRHVIPIASGKGGVGKSTVTANLALALARSGARVGVMDADVYGPSMPTILGVTTLPEMDEHDRLIPVEKDGLKIMSMGFFMAPEQAVVWRGPMLHKTMQQFLGGVIWGTLDYLLVDLPPGTGDIQLSLCQSIPIAGAVIVSTPQDVATNVAQKAVAMFRTLNAPILGLVENMSDYVCPSCGAHDDIFGEGGAKQLAEKLGIAFLGSIPLTAAVRRASDIGKPLVIAAPDSVPARAVNAIAEKIETLMAEKPAAVESQPRVTF
jgi:ATP-binding protein involved in chromosome partitioning